MICCGINDKKVKYYENFRAKLINEENIIQNYLDIQIDKSNLNFQTILINLFLFEYILDNLKFK